MGSCLPTRTYLGLSSPGRLLVRSLSVAVALLDDLGSRSQAAARPLTFNDRRASSQRTPALQASNRNDLTRQGRAGILAAPDAFDATHRSCT